MRTLSRLIVTLALALLCPAISNAAAILDPSHPDQREFVPGWANDVGNFIANFTPSTSVFTIVGVGSYSKAASHFSVVGSSADFFFGAEGGGFDFFTGVPADIRIDAIVQQTGTISGHLLAGILTARARDTGFPAAGIGPGETLIVGHAVDAAALDNAFSVAFLFALDYTHPVLSRLGSYLTFYGPYGTVWRGNGNTFAPWGTIWGPDPGFTRTDSIATRTVPEPGTLALFGIALIGLAFIRSRRFDSRR